jgi:ABC-type glutathione transport system ATPase component
MLGESMFPAVYVNHLLPENSRVLFVGEAAPFYYRSDFTYNTTWDRGPLSSIMREHEGDPAAWIEALRSMQYTHVLVNPVMLDVESMTVQFGGLRALDDVSFDVREGELTAIIGPNGAGKTTLFNCMTGVYRPTSGRVVYRSEHVVTRMKQHRIARVGIARTFQNLPHFDGLSELDNLMDGR